LVQAIEVSTDMKTFDKSNNNIYRTKSSNIMHKIFQQTLNVDLEDDKETDFNEESSSSVGY
jgi:hypothetical protein